MHTYHHFHLLDNIVCNKIYVQVVKVSSSLRAVVYDGPGRPQKINTSKGSAKTVHISHI